MTRTTVLIKNLTRNRLRTTLTVLAIALPMFVFTMARTFVDQVERFLAESDLKLRVAVHQKLSFTSPLPQRIRDEIVEMAPPGYVTAVCRATWFGGRVPGDLVRRAGSGQTGRVSQHGGGSRHVRAGLSRIRAGAR